MPEQVMHCGKKAAHCKYLDEESCKML